MIDANDLSRDSLLDDLYFHLLAREDYIAALRALARPFDAHAGGVFLIENTGIKALATHGIDLDTHKNYHGEFNHQDYVVPFLNMSSSDKTFIASMAVDLAAIEKTDYYNVIDAPNDIHDKLIFHIVTESSQLGVALYRDRKRKFSRDDHRFAGSIIGDMSRCFRLLKRNHQHRTRIFAQNGLTAREVEIIELLRAGNDYMRVCDILLISKNTLKWHLKNIFQKFEVNNLNTLFMRLQ